MNISSGDKLISCLSYLTMGMFGLIWMIYANLAHKRMEYFLYFNICQAIFISLLLVVISVVYNILIQLLIALPFVGNLAEKFNIFFNGTPIYHTYTLSGFIVVCLLVYLCVCSIFAKLPFIPFVSKIIKENLGR